MTTNEIPRPSPRSGRRGAPRRPARLPGPVVRERRRRTTGGCCWPARPPSDRGVGIAVQPTSAARPQPVSRNTSRAAFVPMGAGPLPARPHARSGSSTTSAVPAISSTETGSRLDDGSHHRPPDGAAVRAGAPTPDRSGVPLSGTAATGLARQRQHAARYDSADRTILVPDAYVAGCPRTGCWCDRSAQPRDAGAMAVPADALDECVRRRRMTSSVERALDRSGSTTSASDSVHGRHSPTGRLGPCAERCRVARRRATAPGSVWAAGLSRSPARRRRRRRRWPTSTRWSLAARYACDIDLDWRNCRHGRDTASESVAVDAVDDDLSTWRDAPPRHGDRTPPARSRPSW